jgi:hypothetical protein
MKRFFWFISLAGALVLPSGVRGSTLLEAFLNGAQVVAPTASPATGFGTVSLNNAQNQITVDLSWAGLLSPATAAIIHDAPPGVNGPAVFIFSGVPNATSGTIPEQTFAITAGQVTDLLAGNMYITVHDAVFPGGEIRGQLEVVVPEPATFGLLGIGLGLAAVIARRRRSA